MPHRVKRVSLSLWIAGRNLVQHEGLELSGHLAFSALLALFPLLIVITAVAGLIATDAGGDRLFHFLMEFAPPEVDRTLSPVFDQVVKARHRSILTAGLAITAWTASSGLEALRLTLNRAYGGREFRSWWWRRFQSILLVVLMSLTLLTMSLAVFVGPVVWDMVHAGGGDEATPDWWPQRYVAAGTVLGGVAILLHRFLPAQPLRWQDLWPGVLVSLAAAFAATHIFTLYLSNFARYDLTYGSLGGVVITLLFLYVNAVIFVYGAELNAVLARRR